MERMATENLKLLLVGAGRIAQAHIEALPGVQTLALRGIVDPNESALARLNSEVPTYAELSAAIEKSRPDAALVCTPPADHISTVGALLDAGVHCLVEKPLALTAADAWRLVERADARGLVLQTASKFRAMPGLWRAAGHLEVAGQPVEHAECTFTGKLDIRDDWRARPEVGGGGVFMDNGPHALDVLTALAGPVAAVRAEVMRHVQGTSVEDACEVALQFARGGTGRIVLSWNEALPSPIAVAKAGAVSVEVGWRALQLHTPAGNETLPLGYDKAACFRDVLRQFAQAIHMGGAAEPRGAQGLAVVEAVYESARRSDWVQV
jgi:predicted dehydrogenase